MVKGKREIMKIQIWSDYRCPFCYIGKRNLELALQELNDEYEIEMMSYELDPNFVPSGMSQVEMLTKKYGMSELEAQTNIQRIINMAKQAGLNYDFDMIIDVNTVNAHKVSQYAKLKGKGNAFSEKVLSAYFEQGLNIDDINVLIALGQEVGLDAEGITKAYASDDYLLKVRQDEQWAQMVGVKGVPHFVLDNTVSLSGAQSIETFKDAIAFTKKEIEKKSQSRSNNNLMCNDEGCAI